jgi:hypothetical protein
MRIFRHQIGLIAAVLMFAPLAAAQENASPEGVEVARDAEQLQEVLRPPPDIDFTDTALVFTNPTGRVGYVTCAGYNANGRAVGRIWLKVPANGLRFALASDLSGDVDFIGSAGCWAWPSVVGSAFLLRPGAITDLPSSKLLPLRLIDAEPIPQAALEPSAGSDLTASDGIVRPPQPLPRLRFRIRFPVVATY